MSEDAPIYRHQPVTPEERAAFVALLSTADRAVVLGDRPVATPRPLAAPDRVAWRRILSSDRE